jgi:hypothetical protein
MLLRVVGIPEQNRLNRIDTFSAFHAVNSAKLRLEKAGFKQIKVYLKTGGAPSY